MVPYHVLWAGGVAKNMFLTFRDRQTLWEHARSDLWWYSGNVYLITNYLFFHDFPSGFGNYNYTPSLNENPQNAPTKLASLYKTPPNIQESCARMLMDVSSTSSSFLRGAVGESKSKRAENGGLPVPYLDPLDQPPYHIEKPRTYQRVDNESHVITLSAMSYVRRPEFRWPNPLVS